jgi:hypothetical protein
MNKETLFEILEIQVESRPNGGEPPSNVVQVLEEDGSIFRRHRNATRPYCLELRAIQSFDLLKGVTLHSWPVIDISVRIGETKKRHSLDGPHGPGLRGNRQHHHAQTCDNRGRAKLNHFGIPLFQED